ncbi:MAG TPA: DUF4082 domain-containing protein [Acidimicrobiales bacterium]|nr:DUF4082 domain-containing protein [Acidimicrobiales bacterium]
MTSNLHHTGRGASLALALILTVLSSTVALAVPAAASDCPCTIWPASAAPANPSVGDSSSVELGVKFRADQAGTITGVRFYKGAANTGTHVGSLWDSAGTLLAQATFVNETATGWQQVNFTSGVQVAAGTTYVASYFAPVGRYAGDNDYFATTAVLNSPLKALAGGEDGGNGVYAYAPSSTFPFGSYRSTNYWVDVVYERSGPDTVAPVVATSSPASGATGVPRRSTVTVKFSESVNASLALQSPAGPVATTLSYDDTTHTATWTPTAALDYSTTYTATVTGADSAGNQLAPASWSFTTAAVPPNEGPGGPILVISNADNPFSRYNGDLLRAEGLNEYLAADISTVTPSTLSSYDVAVLGDGPLTDAQVTMLSDWVTAGGNLIAMRPDKKLAGLVGVTDTSSTLADAYLLVDTASGPGAGIVGQTMQFHGTADRYTLSGAAAVATLYADAATATANPAVTLRSVGSSGGQVAAFAYDLARSVVYTRQGNPAWAAQERDGAAPIRSDDKFWGGSQPNYVDLNKVGIPQADEQQRLLANLVTSMTLDRKPLPRLWYLPNGKKAAVVMSGDDHGNGGTTGRFDNEVAQSPAGCNVANWECVRSSSYIYPGTAVTDAQAASYSAQGFEIGVHVSTDCADYTAASLESNYASQLAALAQQLPSNPPQSSERTHCIVFSDWASQPKVEANHGIGLDTNYYWYPPEWAATRPGFMTGSALPMRFADLDGTAINTYQAATQLTDESGQSYPSTVDTLLDRAVGSEGYYGVITANMHTDTAASDLHDLIVASAQARGVPVVSGRQLLTWTQGRDASSFANISWAGSALSFTVNAGAGANGLQGMLPVTGPGGTVLAAVTRGGSAVPFTTQSVKGVQYAFFGAAAGAYVASYGTPDTTAPAISAVAAAPGSGTAVVTWTTNEASTTRVDYGTTTSLGTSVSNGALTTAHSITLTGLTGSTPYYFRVTSADAAGNAATSPASPAAPATFTTLAATVGDATTANFAAGTVGTGAYLAETADGEVGLNPTTGGEFTSGLPSGWSATTLQTGGSAAVSGGKVAVDGARIGPSSTYGPGRSLEFVATFTGAANQSAGFGNTLNETPWAMFGTSSGGALYARSRSVVLLTSTETNTNLGTTYLNAPHRYRIDWTSSSITFSVDGVVKATHSRNITSSMRPGVRDNTTGGGAVTVDWMRMTPYATTGTFTSRVLDAGGSVGWTAATWNADLPSGTAVKVSVSTGNTATPDATWTAFTALAGSGASVGRTSRYIRYQLTLTTSSTGQSPALRDITFNHS